jgi:TonB-dependent starch-binding outer membrane protein SusC
MKPKTSFSFGLPNYKSKSMRKKIYRCLCVSVLLLLVCIKMPAQQRQVTGSVKDAAGATMPGVNLIVKGTTRGTTTDNNGQFAIEANPEDVLTFSFIGYKSVEIAVGSQTNMEVLLTEEVQTLEEVVVVIGYGEVRRADLTGSISSITGEEMRKTNPTTFDQALQGKVPGLVVQQISGQPGGAVSMQIRGLSNFSGASPLYVIDGIIFGGTATLGPGVNPLAGINPADIEAIDVQKDASATAIYGSQATNGVIIITTKRGRIAPPTISYDAFYGVQQLPKKLPVMNLLEYATFINERNTGLGWGFDTRPEFANPKYLGKGTDWQKELFRSAPRASHTVTIQGGDERTQYLFSGSYYKEEGIALGSDLRRISFHLNLDNRTTNWLKIGTSIQMANIKENVNSSSSNVIREALSQTPDIAVRNSDGSWGGAYNNNGWVNRTVNPYAIAMINKDDVDRNQIFGSAYADITIIKDLVLRNEVTGVFSMATEDKFNPSYKMGSLERLSNDASYSFSQNFNTVVRNYLTYSRVFARDFNATVMAAHEAQLSKSEDVSASRTTFPSNSVQVISSGDPNTAMNSGRKGQNAIES